MEEEEVQKICVMQHEDEERRTERDALGYKDSAERAWPKRREYSKTKLSMNVKSERWM